MPDSTSTAGKSFCEFFVRVQNNEMMSFCVYIILRVTDMRSNFEHKKNRKEKQMKTEMDGEAFYMWD